MKLKITVSILVLLAIISFLIFFTYDIYKFDEYKHLDDNVKITKKQDFKIGLITGFGGLGDRSYNDMLYKGIIRVKKQFGIEHVYHAPKIKDDIDKMIIESIEQDSCNIIFCGSTYEFMDIIDTLAPYYPDVKFVLMDGIIDNYHKNIATVSFNQNEGSYLVGYLAAKTSKTKKNRCNWRSGHTCNS